MSTAIMVYKIRLVNLERRKSQGKRYSFKLFFVSSFFLNDTQDNSFASGLIFPHKSIPLNVEDFLPVDV